MKYNIITIIITMFAELAINASLTQGGSVLPLDSAILDRTLAISSIRLLV